MSGRGPAYKNSPGGSIRGQPGIYEEVKKITRQNIKVIVSMGDVRRPAALIIFSCPADKIIANPLDHHPGSISRRDLQFRHIGGTVQEIRLFEVVRAVIQGYWRLLARAAGRKNANYCKAYDR